MRPKNKKAAVDITVNWWKRSEWVFLRLSREGVWGKPFFGPQRMVSPRNIRIDHGYFRIRMRISTQASPSWVSMAASRPVSCIWRMTFLMAFT